MTSISISFRRGVLAAALPLLASQPGCIVLKAQHDELAREVDTLKRNVASQEQQLGEQVGELQALAEQLEAKVKEAEELLRRNQADLGLRVENLEVDAQELRGQAENAEFGASAVNQQLAELRGDLDQRIATLEAKLDEATNIPEKKSELLAVAQQMLKDKKYKGARRLLRTYQSRYPGDEKFPEVQFDIGLTYFSERDYKSSLGEFYRVVQEAPKSKVVHDALYYSGLAFARLGQCKNAIAYFSALGKADAPKQYREQAKKQIGVLEADKGDICSDGDDKKKSSDPRDGGTATKPRKPPRKSGKKS